MKPISASTPSPAWCITWPHPRNVADVTMVDQLLHGEEIDVFGDAGFAGVHKRAEHNRERCVGGLR
ncbi:hypothetical protein BI343_14835 [Chromobacterium amazonense]|nr:hypothetical protein BI343_14835 [Chromobacterium amazonense]